MFHGHSLYRDVTHVPLIIRLPSKVHAGRFRTAVGLHQIPETIGALTGLPKGLFPGASVFDSAASRDSGVVLQLARRTTKVGAQPASRSSISALVMDHWQLIEPHSGRVELFDLAADPRGLRDVAANAVNAETVSVLSQQLKRGDRGRRLGR
jgi:arylsulfatase A-like enzyme